MQTKDYTKMLKGARSERGEPIKVCPKCGRKGAYTGPQTFNGRPLGDQYVHTAEIYPMGRTGGSPISMRVDKDVCYVKSAALATTPAAETNPSAPEA